MTSVTVVGTGAVGGYFGACLQRGGRDVTFVARGRNLEALVSRGLVVSGAMGDFSLPSVTATDIAPRDADLTLLCVKNYDLDEAAAPLAGGHGLVLTLQNGVEAPFRARDLLGPRVLGGSTGIVADLPEPGRVLVTSAYAWIRFGELNGGGVSDRVARAAEWLGVDGIEPIPGPDARVTLWEKMALMCAMAGLTSLHQKPMGELLGDGRLRDTFETIVAECWLVATKSGVPLADDFVRERMRYASGIDPGAMSSMSRDLKRGKRIELETFNGTIVRMGKELGVPVPENKLVYEALREKIT